jgi:endonuclease/exonuclease/phosphatase family metal-dependent hydrolase
VLFLTAFTNRRFGLNRGKPFIAIYLFCLLALTSCSQREKIVQREIQFTDEGPGVIRVMTFNIRNGSAADGVNHWNRRKGLVFDVLADHRADVIGLQEALDFQIQEIRRAMPQYKIVSAGRDDGTRLGEACPILYRRDRFTLSDSGTFWFSNMPWKPGSKNWGNDVPRICTWVRLADRATGSSFYVYNLHLDHASQASREYSVRLLVKELAHRNPKDPVIVLGDFNMDTENSAMAPLRRISADLINEPMVDVWGYLHPGQPSMATYHGFGEQSDGPCLDHILIDRSTEIIEVAIDTRIFGGHYPSDHFPITALVKIRDSDSKKL